MRFLSRSTASASGLIRAFVVRNHCDVEFRARQERLSHYVDHAPVGAAARARRRDRAPEPERAPRPSASTMTVSTIESVVLFGELRSDDLALSDDELAAELTRAFLAYLGVQS